MTYEPGFWKCDPCKFKTPMTSDMTLIRRHLETKKHKRLANACPRCSSLRLTRIPGETWDHDGIREARKCARCKTEYKSFASGISEKYRSEYTGEWPEHIKLEEAEEFDKRARARGYVKADEVVR